MTYKSWKLHPSKQKKRRRREEVQILRSTTENYDKT